MYHSFFVYSSTDGHLGCFQILIIVNNASMNLGMYIFFQISVLGFILQLEEPWSVSICKAGVPLSGSV